ncbi:isocitrate lyase/PEP mutase family protein [Actinomadura hibisca]|uniref:isocitrate lyase/PEP mutase family protein n=1 Tax=Actinomadura hibisca TaxID=68565 RepID=UPI000833FF66|nr:isocitrate lyase/phosphoenolpyruvate mutase family protein [Actinomadura hibisca]
MTSAFHTLHDGPAPLLLPNAWDFASGAALAEAGFAAVGTTSLGVAAAAGKPDGTGGTRAETLALARTLARLPVPVSIDAENGFSTDPGEVAALAAELASLGIAGINLEDGRADGTLAPLPHQAAVIEAVKTAAPSLFVNARTDAYWLDAGRLPEALRRIEAFAAAGANGVFVPGVADDGDVRALVAASPLPLNVLHLPGRTSFKQLADLGVRRVSCGSLLYRTALHAAVTTALAITGDDAPPLPTYQDVQRLLACPLT